VIMFHKSNGAGKGDSPRNVNKRKYDINYINFHGITCPNCKGKGCKFCEKGKLYDGELYFNLGGI
jgi:hypothetical protein